MSLKLIIYYKKTYEYIYSSIMQFVQNPFAAKNLEEWNNLEELLIASCLVGVPWSVLREAFVRRLFIQFVESVKTGGSLSSKQFLAHIFTHNQLVVSNLLFIFCFLVGGRSIAELDRTYDRCCGTLPRAERETMKEQIQQVDKINTMEKFWVSLGMESHPDVDDVEIRDHIMTFLTFIRSNLELWKKGVLPKASIHVPPFGDSRAQAIKFKQDQALEQERELHLGYPKVFYLFFRKAKKTLPPVLFFFSNNF